MTFGMYEFDYLDPSEPEPEPARTHLDPMEAAWLYSQCRDFTSRRFALATVRGSLKGSGEGCIKWHGLQFTDGRVAIWSPSGYLTGNYRSVHTARCRLAKGKLDLYLVWLEPKPPALEIRVSIDGAVTLERHNNPAQQWFMTIGFTAFGPHTARHVALDVSQALDGMLPGYDREEVAIGREGEQRYIASVYCDRNEDCVKVPEHLPPCVDADNTELASTEDGDAP